MYELSHAKRHLLLAKCKYADQLPREVDLLDMPRRSAVSPGHCNPLNIFCRKNNRPRYIFWFSSIYGSHLSWPGEWSWPQTCQRLELQLCNRSMEHYFGGVYSAWWEVCMGQGRSRGIQSVDEQNWIHFWDSSFELHRWKPFRKCYQLWRDELGPS